MLKKLFLWSLYASFVGALLAGAVNRTAAILGETGQKRNNSATNGSVIEANILSITTQENTPVQEKITRDGQVVSATTQGLSTLLSDGQLFEISRRAWQYAQGFGFIAQPGDSLWLEGFYEHDNFEVMRVTNLRTGQSVLLRDSNGHPLWSGGN